MKVMKNLMLASLLVGLGACSDQEQVVPDASKYITVDAGFGTDSRVTTNGLASVFEENDAIGVYVWTGETTLPSTQDGFQVYNVENEFDGTNWSSTPQMLWKDDTTPHYFLAVYPATDILTTTTYMLDPTDQEKSDLLVATNFGDDDEGIVAQSNPVPLAFGHVMAKLRVNIQFNDEFAGTTPTVEHVTAEAQTEAVINWQTATATATGETTGVELTSLATAAQGYACSYESVMVPRSGFQSLAMVIGGETYTFVHGSEIELKRGVITTLNLTVGNSSVEVSDISILDWTLDGAIDGYLQNINAQIQALQAELETLEAYAATTDAELQEAIEAQQTALDKLKAAVEALTKTDGTIATIQGAIVDLQSQITVISTAISEINALKNRIQSIRFLPEYNDGKVMIEPEMTSVDLTFVVSPKEAAAIAKDKVSAFIYHTQSRAVDAKELTVTNVDGKTETGMLTVTVNLIDNPSDNPSENLSGIPADYWATNKTANIYIQINDGNSDITSEMIPAFYFVAPYVTFMSEIVQTLSTKAYIDYDKQPVEVFGLEYSVGGAPWQALGESVPEFGGTKGDLRLRGKCANGTGNEDNYAMISLSGSDVTCSGDIRTLVDYVNYETTSTANASFYGLFEGCTALTDASELKLISNNNEMAESCYAGMFKNCSSLTGAPTLPATTLAQYCYESMFSGCSNLAAAPALPATTLAESCYQSMFYSCSSLTNAPALPATTLAVSCYNGMFSRCSNLVTVPERLPASTLVSSCYTEMFKECKKLTTAPVLPAEKLEDMCYYCMFYKCEKLNSVTMLATDISATNCLWYWVMNVSNSGTFTKAASMANIPTDSDHGIPAGWTVNDYGATGN